MTSLELHNLLRRMETDGLLKRFAMYGRGEVYDSSDRALHPIASPIDQHEWSGSLHGEKPNVCFDQPVFRELAALVAIDKPDRIEFLERQSKLRHKLFDSATTSTPGQR